MKKFFMNLLSSFMGAWIALVVFGVFAVVMIILMVGKTMTGIAEKSAELKAKTVLVLNLDGSIEETETATEFDYSQLVTGSLDKPQTLNVIVKALREGKDNDKIKALYIKCGEVSSSPATVHSIYEAVKEFKTSGKKVYAYGDIMTQGAYYVASLSDSIFLNPQGEFVLQGVSGGTFYLKNLFDKIGVDFQIAKVGTFKSAVEPYIMNEMSEPARAQLDTLYGNIWNVMKDDIAKAKNINASLLDSAVNSCIMFSRPERAVKLGLVSKLCYEREMDYKFARLTGQDKEDLNYLGTADFAGNVSDYSKNDEHVAVLYATGEISETTSAGINCFDLVPVILDLAENDDVKGLVFRVNSPGGSVFGSEQIADALKQFKKTGKPFAVSMGDYAASGGYWISADAERIFADPLTITGSIGIFGVVPNIQPLLQKLGVTVNTVSTNPNGNFSIPFKPLNEAQMAALDANIHVGYDKFIKRVANGRKMPETKVRAIAEGRVYDGASALKLGLVDQLGSLDDAIKWVASKASVDSDAYCFYPDVNPSFWDMVMSAGNDSMGKLLVRSLGDNTSELMVWKLKSILYRKHEQALMMPLSIKL